ncbi:hypothetical protein L3X38_033270 [Prunus dulcis]|uniref:DUF8040 domain-containing protein n=1 Tax=Prunus dulcis TaxID=3755 RepID=A0AAD4VHZ3_PRUDU|nr:hypothetical protein L3X38_033270 [Prunus dulcis]
MLRPFVYVALSSSSSSPHLRLHLHPLIFVFVPSSKSEIETRPSSTGNREIPCFSLLQSSYTLSWKILISFPTLLEDLPAKPSGKFGTKLLFFCYLCLDLVTASEDVWASYLKSKPKGKQFRTQGLEHYQLLGEIFNITTATGQLHYASSQLPPNSDNERKRKCATTAPPERRPKKWDKMESYLDVCSEVMSQTLQARKLEASSTSKEMYSIEECIDIVETMRDIDNDTFNKMLEKIVLVEWRKIFVTMLATRRRVGWLVFRITTYVLDMSTKNEDNHSDSDSDLEEMEHHMTICMHICEYWQSYVDRTPCHNSILSGHEYVQELLNGHPYRIYDSFCMEKHVFQRLCYALESLNLIQNDRHVSTQEAVAIFLFIVSYSIRMRVAAKRFQRSKDTIHRQFKRILGALCALAPRIIRPQSRGETPSQILNNPKYYPYFEKCIGAIDGTHVAPWAPAQKQTSYRGRKILITQNVMCACSFDMMFTFVYMGWEGTANDSRVFIDAVMRPENVFPFPDEGLETIKLTEPHCSQVSEITLQVELQSSQVSEITLQSEPQSWH